jgi:hypothetical protein
MLHPIKFEDLPRRLVLHLENRIRERKINPEDLARWHQWVATNPVVPDEAWWKDFGSFILVGDGPYPKSILSPDMKIVWGTKLAYLLVVEGMLGEG